MPPFFKGKGTKQNGLKRNLQANGPLDNKAYKNFKQQFKGEEEKPYVDQDMSEALKQILDFKIQSSFFDSESDELGIDQLELITFTETEFEIQITFKNTNYISQSMTEPDIVEVRFKKSDIFVDAETYEVLEPNFVM